MPNKYNSIAVIDVESTCWSGTQPPNQKSEIIEIGITELILYPKVKLGRSVSIMIKPVMSSVSEFCTLLTTLTQEDVDKGISFKDACQKMKNDFGIGKEKVWASYGDYDRKMFVNNCKDLNVDYPFGDTHFNVKAMLALMMGWTKEVGMAKALDNLGMKLEGIHHRGDADSRNIARIFMNIITS